VNTSKILQNKGKTQDGHQVGDIFRIIWDLRVEVSKILRIIEATSAIY
jgi:hypothetical protein